MKKSILTSTDSYKVSHSRMYPKHVSNASSYFESRGGRYKHTVFFGLQGKLDFLDKTITKEDVDEANDFFARHGEPFNRDGWMHIVNEYDGKLPLIIRAVPEGTIVPTGNVLLDVTLSKDDPKCHWLVSYVETYLVRTWYPTTVCTLSHYCKEIIYDALTKSSERPDEAILFALHDFGSRGVSSGQSAEDGGAAHLVNFLGSDTVEGIIHANETYGTKDGMCGFSIPASEHSTITMWGRNGEVDAYRNIVQEYLIDRVVPPGMPKIVACVSDSYNVYNAVENIWCGELHEMVKNSGGKLVIRPDSGDPIEVLLKILGIIDRKIGMKTNSLGYKIIPPYLGLIQGDGINDESIGEILHAVMARGYSAECVAFGMGGGLLQQVNRDTLKFAFKCSAAKINGEWVNVQKDPITDKGKRSKAGRLSLVMENGAYKTVPFGAKDDILVPVFENGKVLRRYTMDEVRANTRKRIF